MKASRIKEIADYISQHEQVQLETLAEEFDVSIYTIRRDVDELAKKGIVKKNYGGVSINKEGSELIDFQDRNTVLKAEKKDISKCAASLIEDGDIVYIDGGTTTLYMPDYLDGKRITVVTNNIFVILKVLRMDHIKLIVLGGELDRRANSITGLSTIESMKNMNITKAFISTTGVSKDFQVTNYTAVEAELKRSCMEKSGLCYLLADHTKFGHASLVSYAKLEDFDGVVTDEGLSTPYQDYLYEHQIKIHCE